MLNLKTVDFGVAFTLTRPAPADYEDKDGNTQTAAANEPRFNYSNGVAQGLLLDASLSETAAIDNVPAFNASAGHWVIDATFDGSEPLKGIGLDWRFSGSGKMVVSYSGGTAKVWAGGQAIHTVTSYTPVEPTHICEGGMATIVGLTYKPSAISDADAAALATGDFELAPFAPDELFANGEKGAWYDPSDLATLFTDSAGTTPVTADDDPAGMALDKHIGLELGSELVTNGDFETDVSGWTTGSGFSIDWDNGAAYIERSGGINDAPKQNIGLETGKYYKVQVDISQLSDQVSVYLGTPSLANEARFYVTGQGLNGIVRATGTDVYIAPTGDPTATCTIDNISVRELPGNHAVQNTTSAKPMYRTDGTLHWLEFDGDDDALVANISGITNATVAIAKSTGTEITYPVDLSSGTFTMNETNYGVIVREGELTAQEEAGVIAYLNEKAGVS